MGWRTGRVIAREFIRLLIAVAVASLIAGELLDRSLHRRVSPLPDAPNGHQGNQTIIISDQELIRIELYENQDATRIYCLSVPTLRLDLQGETQIADSPSRLLAKLLREQHHFEAFSISGWPLRFAEGATQESFVPFHLELMYPSGEVPEAWVRQDCIGLEKVGPLRFATRPVFPGFLVLAIFLYSILLLPRGSVKAVRMIRTGIRVRRGVCPKCGYLIGIPSPDCCPEFGTQPETT